MYRHPVLSFYKRRLKKSGTPFRFEVSILLYSLTAFDKRCIMPTERHYHNGRRCALALSDHSEINAEGDELLLLPPQGGEADVHSVVGLVTVRTADRRYYYLVCHHIQKEMTATRLKVRSFL